MSDLQPFFHATKQSRNRTSTATLNRHTATHRTVSTQDRPSWPNIRHSRGSIDISEPHFHCYRGGSNIDFDHLLPLWGPDREAHVPSCGSTVNTLILNKVFPNQTSTPSSQRRDLHLDSGQERAETRNAARMPAVIIDQITRTWISNETLASTQEASEGITPSTASSLLIQPLPQRGRRSPLSSQHPPCLPVHRRARRPI